MFDKKTEVSFLVDNFGIPAVKAAEVISSDEAEIRELAAGQLRAERQRNPFADDAKVPASPQDNPVKNNGGLQKPVLYRENRAGQAGP